VTLNVVDRAKSNTFAFETSALVKATGLPACWWLGHRGSEKELELNLIEVQALGRGLGFDGDGDRCCDVDGVAKFSRRETSPRCIRNPPSSWTRRRRGFLMMDPALAQNGAMTDYGRPGTPASRGVPPNSMQWPRRRNPEVVAYNQTF